MTTVLMIVLVMVAYAETSKPSSHSPIWQMNAARCLRSVVGLASCVSSTSSCSFLHFLTTAEGSGHWSKTGKVCVLVVLAAE